MNQAGVRPATCGPPDYSDRNINEIAREAKNWLFDDVLPLWADAGHDAANGGFFEQIRFDGAPIGLPKRCGVQARQAYSFLEAGRIGWSGPWKELAESGLNFMLAHHVRPDGFMRFGTELDGTPYDDCAENYDQAFAIFVLAHGYAASHDQRFLLAARAILDALRRERAHPCGGFFEAPPQCGTLLSNPHMHLFEAALAWLDVAPTTSFRDLAKEINLLCQCYFIDPSSGILREYFEGYWTPRAGEDGRIFEPGHQFEWAWLLARWRDHGGDVDEAVIRGLYDTADGYGVDQMRSVALRELWIDGSVRDAGARMWAQTERMKAALTMARLWQHERARYETDAISAWAGMRWFILPENRGLFRDKMRADGSFLDEGALASSLYHIVYAISVLVRYANDGRGA